ncbi:MAG: hypothetical protein JNM78_13820 [Cyclobacteriaceae bacterium]|nr:hypothetical protein [Cyclobacteriaceae bacterium]
MTLTIRLFIIILIPLLSSCAYNDLADKFSCDDSDLRIKLLSKADATSCRSINGSIVVEAQGGEPGYDFSLNNGVYQTNPGFSNLAPGIYEVTVKDLKGCISVLSVEISSPDTNLGASINTQSDTQCTSDNGSIAVQGQGGTGSYLYQLGATGFGTQNIFTNLKHGTYTVIVKDNDDCQKVINVLVPRGNTGTSFLNDIKPIFTANCTLSGCHDAGTGSRDWTTFSNVKNKAEQIKARTANKSMPIGGLTLTQEQINLIACWVDDGAINN